VHFLPGAFAKGNALRDRGRHGAGEFRFVVEQRVIPGGHRDLHSGFQVSQMAELADDPPTDLLDHVCNVGIAGRLTLEKAGCETLVRAIEKNTLHDDHMVM
jgi:hypothetical protein